MKCGTTNKVQYNSIKCHSTHQTPPEHNLLRTDDRRPSTRHLLQSHLCMRESNGVVEFFRVQSERPASFMCSDIQIEQIGWYNSQPRQSRCPSVVAAWQVVELIWKQPCIACINWCSWPTFSNRYTTNNCCVTSSVQYIRTHHTHNTSEPVTNA
jgi:hypothetical protein